MAKSYDDIYYKSTEGLTLYARDYAPKSTKPVVFCMHGLTRNSADFHNLARHLSDRFRVISVDQRGRGNSGYDSKADNYRPDVYCADMFTLLDHLGLHKVIAIGTSMGGIMAMMMAATQPRIFKAVILNDIGPELDPAGLERIKGYVGKTASFENWNAAAAALRAQGPDVFPDYIDDDWAAFARRTCREAADGTIHFAYDPVLAQPFNTDDTASSPVDMWPIFSGLMETPVLSIRGALSDLLSRETTEKMAIAHPNFAAVEIPRIGHAPMLDEPESLVAIDAFLEPYL